MEMFEIIRPRANVAVRLAHRVGERLYVSDPLGERDEYAAASPTGHEGRGVGEPVVHAAFRRAGTMDANSSRVAKPASDIGAHCSAGIRLRPIQALTVCSDSMPRREATVAAPASRTIVA